MKFSNRRNRQNAEISMLNLIDVIFMLLIFFMIDIKFLLLKISMFLF